MQIKECSYEETDSEAIVVVQAIDMLHNLLVLLTLF